jgi:hypothetical protein
MPNATPIGLHRRQRAAPPALNPGQGCWPRSTQPLHAIQCCASPFSCLSDLRMPAASPYTCSWVVLDTATPYHCNIECQPNLQDDCCHPDGAPAREAGTAGPAKALEAWDRLSQMTQKPAPAQNLPPQVRARLFRFTPRALLFCTPLPPP